MLVFLIKLDNSHASSENQGSCRARDAGADGCRYSERKGMDEGGIPPSLLHEHSFIDPDGIDETQSHMALFQTSLSVFHEKRLDGDARSGESPAPNAVDQKGQVGQGKPEHSLASMKSKMFDNGTSVPWMVSNMYQTNGTRIPSKICFNFKVDLFEDKGATRYPETYLNLQRTILRNPGFEVIMYNDTTCRAAIARVHSEALAKYFDAEQSGAYKSDVCRLAMLIEHGGYYLDNDIEVITDLFSIAPAKASFVTVLAKFQPPGGDGNEVMQGFIGSTPGHPALKLALDQIWMQYLLNVVGTYPDKGTALLEHTENMTGRTRHMSSTTFLGTRTLADALMQWTNTKKITPGYTAVSAQEGLYILQEDGVAIPNDESRLKIYGLERRNCCVDNCNMFVVNVDTKQPAFWTRFTKKSMLCQ